LTNIVEDGKNGYTVDINTVKEWSDKINLAFDLEIEKSYIEEMKEKFSPENGLNIIKESFEKNLLK